MKNPVYEMLRIRMIEQEIARRYPEGKMRCPVHLSIGQEAPAAGLCAALDPKDKMVSSHRAHAHYLAKGGSLKGLIGELYGKSTGCSRGNGGSMHLIDLSVDFWGSTSIVAGTIPVGVGLAFADKIKGQNHTTVICFGDAAIEEGVFHESANFAALHKLNVIFFLENNQYSCYTHISQRQPNRPLVSVARAHGLHYVRTDRTLHSIRRGVAAAKDAAMGGAPTLIAVPTYRHLEHCGPNNDDHLGYRDPNEIRTLLARDPLANPSPMWAEQIKPEIDEAFADAEAAPFPDSKEVGAYVFA